MSDRASTYDIEAEWSPADLALLRSLEEAETLLPPDAPRALLSVRLSVFTEDTTSPVRQELDLRQLARDKGMRVVGVASDLNVSATKVPPWKRKELGDWLGNKTPQFDALLFWKIDRFIRNMGDLSRMIEWANRYEKNLISKNDPIDLKTPIGKMMTTLLGGVAEIESANTKARVESLWDYAKTQSDWLVGKPAYGYVTQRDESGKVSLAVDPKAREALHLARELVLGGMAARSVAEELKKREMVTPGLTAATLLRRMRNPALMGYRVEEDKRGGLRRSKLVLGHDGKPIRVADPVFTEEEFETLQAVLDSRGKNQPPRQPSGATKFLGVLKCVDCRSNMIVHFTRNKHGEYAYLRCQKCKSGGLGAPHPQEVYDALVEQVLAVLGDFPVERREYARGEEARAEVKRLEESIAYYMQGLEPGGRYTKTRFTRENAERALDKLIAELEAVDPETTEDRWIYEPIGKTFRQHWEEGGMEAMALDLIRAGITCDVTRTKVPRVRAPQVELDLDIPSDVRERLVMRRDDFAEAF
ncbi:integrase [Streptomyces phage Lannister]|uniref:Serine integrase n=1 Tax=Streptomyces phage Lannister TaxID=1674927 RepID=A0A0K1YA06_9CAUD|nr:integrase [Streptomyces phage Lannister]AKY03733.1 serine integrase [Streptomyces phage Lannister]